MYRAYSNPKRAKDSYSLPDLEVFQMTAREIAESDQYEDERAEYIGKKEFRLAAMNTNVREKMFDAMIEELGITGGWFYWFCLPGCLPDSSAFGPFKTAQEAIEDARENAGDDDEIEEGE